ncbi:recombinase family protein [Paenibacillus sp. YN15]|uniref:recombinase family protein n=1 Tax=Paenibacillus sp. YN15 TaxID=1742774 RepID=UPI000DCCBD8D|nr:recombinase family protein [Paenibacillus sp. YN15]RAV06622.1 hypothetical protein DQG13_01990 [Paenibacillus sp. YN15]
MLVVAHNGVKRVAILLRVSTKKQTEYILGVNQNDFLDDIPGQRKSCMEFISKQPGWQYVKEYREAGVSGFKVSESKRDVLQDAKRDAENGLFDVLLVFKFDRLGRLDDETPFVLQWFVKKGIEMWSVVEGQQKIEGQMDKLINYLTFWQANTESVNTSIRVNEKHSQMVEEGVYRGGSIPFGYRLEKSGKFNKKGKELLMVVIDPEEAAAVRWVYALADQEGYGQYRLAKLLNEKKIKTKRGGAWASNMVSHMLNNPMYKGYYVYARGTDKEVMSKVQIPELVIINEDQWARVQKIREERSPENTKKNDGVIIVRSTKGSLLFVGMIRCGTCGNPLTATPNHKTYISKKTGKKTGYRSMKYRCSGKASQKVVDCRGQTMYSQNIIEGLVMDEVYSYLDQLQTIDLTNEIEKMRNRNLEEEARALSKCKQQLKRLEHELSKYKEEVLKVIMGESSFDRDMLSGLIKKKEQEVGELKEEHAKLEQELAAKKVERTEMEALQRHIPNWRKVFEAASIAKRKMMLRTIIGGILVYRDRVEVTFKLRISQFLDVMGSGEFKSLDAAQYGRVLTYNSVAGSPVYKQA